MYALQHDVKNINSDTGIINLIQILEESVKRFFTVLDIWLRLYFINQWRVNMFSSQTLNGRWNLYFGLDAGRPLKSREEALELGYQRIGAIVPGNIELDLVEAGLAEDPFLKDNVLDYEKFEQYSWWFERKFMCSEYKPGQKAVLVFKGINTYADIYVNGKKIGCSDNMLIEHEFDVTDVIKLESENTIAVSIRSAMMQARNEPMTVMQQGGSHLNEIPLLRMPPHCFGWDIMPRLLSAGLWRDVVLEYRSAERFSDVYIFTESASGDAARLGVFYIFESDKVNLPLYKVKVSGSFGESSFEKEGETHFVSNRLHVEIPNPKLWWPKGYGAQNLYEITVTLIRGETVCDERKINYGIRTATIDAEFEGNNKRFAAVVNGEKIFVRGTNWVPLSAFHSLDEKRLEKAFSMLVNCGVNAVRCWGGNVYENDEFYNLCDKYGILVWQDFAMACSIQRSDDAFAATMEKEATAVIRRLRNHSCLLLWAGDNEVDQFYASWFPKGHARYNRITREVLPRTCATNDPMRYYLSSSPYIHESLDTDLEGPEQHLWGPRDDFKCDFL